MLTLNDTGCTGRFDSRTPLTATQASVQTVAEAALRAAGFAVQGDMDPPITCRRATLSSAPWPSVTRPTPAKRAVPGHRRRHLCPRHSRRGGLRAQHAGVRLQPPRARRKRSGWRTCSPPPRSMPKSWWHCACEPGPFLNAPDPGRPGPPFGHSGDRLPPVAFALRDLARSPP